MRLFLSNGLVRTGSPADYVAAARARGHELIVRMRGHLAPEDGVDFAFDSRREVISWSRVAVHETGFWHSSSHADFNGLWAQSSLNYEDTAELVQSFEAPVSARDITLKYCKVPTKYSQPENAEVLWNGVVLAAQTPNDMSIGSLGPEWNAERYWGFVAEAGRKYGSDLFIKIHPRYGNLPNQRLRSIAKRFGCAVGHCDHSVLNECAFCLVYCSTFAVDCFVRRVPVVQYAPGYFYQTGAVMYVNGLLPKVDQVRADVDAAERLADFMAWHYCFDGKCEPDRMIQILESFACAEPNVLFPLPESLSYADSVLRDNVFAQSSSQKKEA